MEFCLDNAAMIAGLGHARLASGEADDLHLAASPSGSRARELFRTRSLREGFRRGGTPFRAVAAPGVHGTMMPCSRSATNGWRRTGGPGGQHRNRVDSKVILTHRPTGIESAAGERRSADRQPPGGGPRACDFALALHVRTPVPVGEIGSELWRSRRRVVKDDAGKLSGRISCSPNHHDFPSLIAEALDVMAAANWDPKKAGTTAGSLDEPARAVPQGLPPRDRTGEPRAANAASMRSSDRQSQMAVKSAASLPAFVKMPR